MTLSEDIIKHKDKEEEEGNPDHIGSSGGKQMQLKEMKDNDAKGGAAGKKKGCC